MARIAVVTDSAACIPASLKQSLGIYEIPFELVWDGVVYRDGVDLAPAEFYQRFRAQKHLPDRMHPTTSQPPLGAFLSLYTQLAQQFDGIVSIHVAGEMTGTVRTAQFAAHQLNPIPIRVIDSRTATIAEGFVVIAAARVAAQGASIDQVVAAAQPVIDKVDFFAALKTLEHIHRGGRLGEAATLLGSQLKIVPILNLKNGRVSVVGVTRSWKHALEEIIELSVARLKGKTRVHASVFYGDALEDARWLQNQLLARVTCVEFYLSEFTPVMGAHTGPDVVGIVFYADD
jgi:DegV family protein with EDD domain